MIGKKNFDVRVQQEKSYQNSQLTFLRLEKRLKKQSSVINTALHASIYLLKVFLWDGTDLKFDVGDKGEKYPFRITSRTQNFEFVG